jgi:hypothetical protein
MCLTVSSSAFIVSGGFKKMPQGYFSRMTKVNCSTDEYLLCQLLCDQDAECEREEPFCRNCGGTSSTLLRELFTEISKLYKIKDTHPNRFDLVQFLKTEVYVLLDLKSIYDYYNSADSKFFTEELRKFCGTNTETAQLAIVLDSVNQPQELRYVLCQDVQNQTIALEVESRYRGMGPIRLTTPILFSPK